MTYTELAARRRWPSRVQWLLSLERLGGPTGASCCSVAVSRAYGKTYLLGGRMELPAARASRPGAWRAHAMGSVSRACARSSCTPPTEVLVVAQVSRSTTTLRFMTTIVLQGAHRPAPLTSRARRARTVWNILPFLPFSLLATAPGVAGAQQLSYSSGQVVVSTAAVDKRSGRTTSTMDRELPAAAAAWLASCCRRIRQDRAHCALIWSRSGRWRSACCWARLLVVLATCWRVSLECSWGAGGWGRVHLGLKHDERTETSLFSPLV